MVWKQAVFIKDNLLPDCLNKAVYRGDMIGYNLLSNAALPDFDDDMTIIYGHSDL